MKIKELKELIIRKMTSVVDFYRKPKILKWCKKLGCDVDGDTICYKGTWYLVFELRREVIRIEKIFITDEGKRDKKYIGRW